jgi:hypothetical protein
VQALHGLKGFLATLDKKPVPRQKPLLRVRHEAGLAPAHDPHDSKPEGVTESAVDQGLSGDRRIRWYPHHHQPFLQASHIAGLRLRDNEALLITEGIDLRSGSLDQKDVSHRQRDLLQFGPAHLVVSSNGKHDRAVAVAEVHRSKRFADEGAALEDLDPGNVDLSGQEFADVEGFLLEVEVTVARELGQFLGAAFDEETVVGLEERLRPGCQHAPSLAQDSDDTETENRSESNLGESLARKGGIGR